MAWDNSWVVRALRGYQESMTICPQNSSLAQNPNPYTQPQINDLKL